MGLRFSTGSYEGVGKSYGKRSSLERRKLATDDRRSLQDEMMAEYMGRFLIGNLWNFVQVPIALLFKCHLPPLIRYWEWGDVKFAFITNSRTLETSSR